MKRLLILAVPLALAGCATEGTTPVSSGVPVVGAVCTTINSSSFDTALKAYDAATDAVNLLIDFKVLTPGSATAKKVADANDAVLAAFAAAENARSACNATSYLAALNDAKAAIAEIRAALPKK